MRKIILICALFLGATAIGIASEGEISSSVSMSISSKPSKPTHKSLCVTNPDNLPSGKQEWFLFAYDEDGVIWVFGTYNETFSSPIRTAPTGRSDFQYKFMRAGVLWYLPV